MGYVSSIIKGQSTSSKSGIWWQEEKIPEGDQLAGKYQSTYHYSDGNYAKVWYNGDKFDPVATYTDRYCREHKLGKYANATGEKTSSASNAGKPKSFAGKLGSILGSYAMASVAGGIEKSAAEGNLPKPKKVLPKPKSARPKPASATSPTGGLKSLLSEKRSGILKAARPAAAESRSGLLGRLKSGTAKKGTGLLGGKTKSAAPKKGGLLGGGTKSAAPKKGGLLGGGTKSAAPKKGGLLGGGGMKKSSGLSLGKKKR